MNNKIEVKIEKLNYTEEELMINEVKEQSYYASMLQFPGMVCTGRNAKNAFDELMISLRVKIMCDNNLFF